MTELTIRSGDVDLAVRGTGDPAGATVVLVHGFPDTQGMWGPVVDRLQADYHVVTYDVRGAGASSAPASRSGYRMARLVDDLVAVLDETLPGGERAHLVGHDWGSVQLWGVVTREADDDRLRDRIASYTTISGPCLDHFGHFFRASLEERQWGRLFRQIAHSWYIGAFQVPAVPELVFRRFGDRIEARLIRSQRLGEAAHWADTFAEDGAHGVNLYRANGVRMRSAYTRVPVQLIVPEYDAFLTPAVYEHLGEFVTELTRVDMKAGHWVPRTHPDEVAEHISAFARDHAA